MKRIIFMFLCILYSVVWGEESVAVVTSVSGQADVVRDQDTVSYPVVMLDQLFAGDSLYVKHGDLTLLYKAGTVATFEENRAVVIAPTSDSTPVAEGDVRLSEEVRYSLASLFETGTGIPKHVVSEFEDSLVPVFTIFVPGNTSLSTARPDVIWSRWPDANWYSVVFHKKGNIVINNATTDTLMPFVEQNEDLTPDSYIIRVHAFHNKDTLISQQCSIRIIDSSEVETVKEKISMLDRAQIDEYTRDLLKAIVYQDHLLLVRAVQYYESMCSIRPEDPFPYKALAYVYDKLGLGGFAEDFIQRYKALYQGYR